MPIAVPRVGALRGRKLTVETKKHFKKKTMANTCLHRRHHRDMAMDHDRLLNRARASLAVGKPAQARGPSPCVELSSFVHTCELRRRGRHWTTATRCCWRWVLHIAARSPNYGHAAHLNRSAEPQRATSTMPRVRCDTVSPRARISGEGKLRGKTRSLGLERIKKARYRRAQASLLAHTTSPPDVFPRAPDFQPEKSGIEPLPRRTCRRLRLWDEAESLPPTCFARCGFRLQKAR